MAKIVDKIGWPICIIAVAGILAVAGIEIMAIWKGEDGTYLSITVAAIVAIVAGLGGFKIGKLSK